MTRIKFLVDEGSYRYILSGSLLGVELHNLRSAPVGYVSIIDMYPMDFEEFAIALGVKEATIHMLKDCYIQKLPVDEFVHKKMLDVFYLYLIIWGMPEAIVQYLETNNIQKVSEVQSKVITFYQMDFSKYDIHQAVILSNANVEQKANRLYYPIYMIIFFQNEKIHEPIYKLDLSEL